LGTWGGIFGASALRTGFFFATVFYPLYYTICNVKTKSVLYKRLNLDSPD